MAIRAVFFDLGGVVFESPLEEIARFEAERGLPAGLVNSTVVSTGPEGAWARHERGELGTEEFLAAFARELGERGYEVDTAELMERVQGTLRPRPLYLRAVDRLRGAGLRVAAVTNNWEPFGDGPVVARFDVVVESVIEGVRKPDPEIYRRALARVRCTAAETVMLDDLGPNLKTARALGMTTIKVEDPEVALGVLGELVDLDLVSGGLR